MGEPGPKSENLKILPFQAVVAFAVRCARRVQPLLRAGVYHAKAYPPLRDTVPFYHLEPHFREVEKVLQAAEICASGGDVTVDGQYDEAIGNILSSLNTDASSAARHAALQAFHAAFSGSVTPISGVLDALRMIFSRAEPLLPPDALSAAGHAAFAAEEAILAAKRFLNRDDPLVPLAIWHDLATLLAAALGGRWQDDTPVPQAVFGEKMWPLGTPKGWPPEGTHVIIRPVPEPAQRLSAYPERISEALATIQDEFKKDLLALERKNFGSLEENQRVAAMIQDTADRLRLAFVCPKCGEPARFRCSRSQTSKTGMFTFGHSVGSHGGTVAIPRLTVTERPEHGLRLAGREE